MPQTNDDDDVGYAETYVYILTPRQNWFLSVFELSFSSYLTTFFRRCFKEVGEREKLGKFEN